MIEENIKDDCVAEGFDVCYGCGNIFPYGVLKDVDPVQFDIFCPECNPELYTEQERIKVNALKEEIK